MDNYQLDPAYILATEKLSRTREACGEAFEAYVETYDVDDDTTAAWTAYETALANHKSARIELEELDAHVRHALRGLKT